MPGPLQREERRRRTALEILAGLGLLERWRAYGEAVLVGAAAYGLVVAPDIDLEIYCPGDPRIEDGFALLAACAQLPGVRKARFSNRLHAPDQGLYWQLRCLHSDGVEWKVDMWSMRRDHPGPLSRDLVEPMRRCLTEETRAAILDIKEQLLAAPEPRCPSITVYQAVMAGGVRSLAGLAVWRAQHSEQNPEAGLTAWKPG